MAIFRVVHADQNDRIFRVRLYFSIIFTLHICSECKESIGGCSSTSRLGDSKREVCGHHRKDRTTRTRTSWTTKVSCYKIFLFNYPDMGGSKRMEVILISISISVANNKHIKWYMWTQVEVKLTLHDSFVMVLLDSIRLYLHSCDVYPRFRYLYPHLTSYCCHAYSMLILINPLLVNLLTQKLFPFSFSPY